MADTPPSDQAIFERIALVLEEVVDLLPPEVHRAMRVEMAALTEALSARREWLLRMAERKSDRVEMVAPSQQESAAAALRVRGESE